MKKIKSIIWIILISLSLSIGTVGCSFNLNNIENILDEVREAHEEDAEDSEDEEEKEDADSAVKNDTNDVVGINQSATEEYGSLKNFSTRTLSGEKFTQDDLAEYDITMVNFWGTYCSPCIEELPEMAELSRELPENVRIISVCTDASWDKDLAQEIVEDNKVDFPVLIDNDSLNDAILNNIMFVPLTIFVDSEGNIVANTVDGAPMNPKEDYRAAINEALNAIGKADLDGKQSDVTINDVESSDETYDDFYAIPETFDDYYYSYGIPKAIQLEYEDVYSALAKEVNDGDISYEEFSELLDEKINAGLREQGFYVPYSSADGLIEEIDGLSTEDYTFLVDKFDYYIGEESYELSDEEYYELEDELRAVFEKYGLNFDEVISQLYGNNIQFAVYNVSGSKVQYNDNLRANDFTVTEEQREAHLYAIQQVRDIIPADIWKQIGQIEFNTDGLDMVLAYTIPVGYEFSTTNFRLALDISDIMDEEGNLTEYGISTIIHETGHIITLNADQAKEACWYGWGDEAEEDRYQEDSYIMTFYDKFWRPTANEFNGVMDPNDMDAVDAAYIYYDEHPEDFVSDYAAQNVEEDMAESFMTFVLEDKPTGDSLADQKVLFYYAYPEMVEYRNQYRSALNK